ncbi:MAG: type II toxin-antitoxin system HicB family antitoxin [Moraxellaceae bacterium]|nr:type II toxin-antitoxin system HicB family antitoxin [Moraxellaceae bacterium]
MFDFAVRLEPDADTASVVVYFRDLPQVFSAGSDSDEALLNAVDALETALDACIRNREPFPLPRKPRRGDTVVSLPAQATIKACLHNEMLVQGVRKSELARRLHLHMPQVDRLLDVRHSTKLETLEAAATALGKKLEIGMGAG